MRLYSRGLITVASRLRSVILTFDNDQVTVRYRIQILVINLTKEHRKSSGEKRRIQYHFIL